MNISNTDQQYYDNPEFWGEAQYITLKDVINNILITADDDSYFKKSMYFRASIFGKLAIKKMNVDIAPKRKAISFALSPSKIFPFPRFMTNWYRISVLNKCDMLTPLKLNTGTIIHDYLQDNEFELLYDDKGEILEGLPFNAEVGTCLKFQCNTNPDCGCTDDSFKDSWVRENKEGSYFEFSDDLIGEEIVIEFLTAGLESINDCDLKIHNDLELTITRFIQWNLLLGKRNVPTQEVREFERLYKAEKRRSERFLGNKITVSQILDSYNLRYN